MQRKLDHSIGLCCFMLLSLSLFAAHDRPVTPPSEGSTRLVKDLNPAVEPQGFQRTSDLVPLGDKAFFLGGTGEWDHMASGLWITDGTPSGTHLIRSLPTQGFGGATGLAASGGRLFFFTSDGMANRFVWTSDGTGAGTLPLIRTGFSVSEPYTLVPVGDRMCFLRYPGTERDVELWVSDGTAEGTRMLKRFDDPDSIAAVGGLCGWNGKLAFRGWDPLHGSELWMSDGTPEGTWVVKDLMPGAVGGAPDTLTPFGDRLVLIAATGEYGAREVWTSDGTEAGTLKIAGAPELYDAYHLTPAGGLVYFRAFTADLVFGLWRTNGTAEGTLYLGPLDVLGWSRLTIATLSGPTALFAVRNGAGGYDLWRSDGTTEGTRVVRDLSPSWVSGPYAFTSISGIVYFGADDSDTGAELWRSDGTAAGTYPVSDICPGPASSWPDMLQVWGDRLWFQAGDCSHGVEPWTSDGTAEGTRMFANLAPDVGSSTFPSLIPWGEAGVLMESGDGWHPYQLWASDGIPEGTQALMTFDPDTYWRPPGALVSRGDLAFFSLFSTALGNEVWATDGTVPGTHVVRDILPGPTGSIDARVTGAVLDREYYFSGSDGIHGLEPWATDGTAADTRMVADLCTDPAEGNPTLSSWPDHFLPDTGRLFFTARGNDGNAGWYRYDTASGARLLADLMSPFDQITIGPGAVSGGKAFLFTQTYGAPQWDLWRSDGTPEGTAVIASFPIAYQTWWQPGPLFPFDERIWFQAASDSGAQLWVSDGTPGGTYLFKAIGTEAGSSHPSDLVALGNHFFFRANDGIHGAELWTSDGTEAGTVLLKDLCPGLCSGDPMDLASDGERIYFSATDDLHGQELWVTDGTGEGTRMAADIQRGPGSSAPEQITPSGSTIYFTAADGATGRELWRYDPPTP
jgi:ELWxxDGT repeat protein